MAQFMVMVADKTHPLPSLDIRQWKSGDVVQVFPDSHRFTEYERRHPLYRIIKIPQISWTEAAEFLQEDIRNGSRVRRRAVRFDLDRLPSAIKKALADRSVEIIEVNISKEAALALRSDKVA